MRFLCSTFVFLFLAACSRPPTNVETGARDQVLHLGNGAEPQSIDPHFATSVRAHNILSYLLEGLMEADPKTLEPIPSVAESWDISEDQRVYTFHLRGNARWPNRDPVSEHDFAYSYRCMLNPDLTAQYGYILHVFNNAQLYNEGHKCDGKGVVIAAENRVYLHQFGQVKFARLRAFLMGEDPALTKLPAYSVRA